MRFLPAFLVCLLYALPSAAQWGGELRIALHSEPKTLDPAMVEDDASDVVRTLTGGVLVRVNRLTQVPQPWLAESWKVQEGGRTPRFHLRQGIRFSDGTPFTADDVVYTMETLMDPKLHSPVGDTFRTGSGAIRVWSEGPDTVVIRFPDPLAAGVRLFDQVAIRSRRSPLKDGAVLGPFRVADRKPGSYLRLERNPHYWRMENGHRLPYLDAVRAEIIQNRDIELLRFGRGELHLASALDTDQFEELSREKPAWVKDLGSALDNEFLWFNLSPAAPLPDYEKA